MSSYDVGISLTDRPSKMFGVMVVIMALAQLSHLMELPFSALLVAVAVGLSLVGTLFMSTEMALLFLVLIALTRITIPPTDREMQEVVLPVLASLLFLRNWRDQRWRIRQFPVLGALYVILALAYVVHGFEWPRGYSVVGGESTGFRARWGLLVSVIAFIAVFFSFRIGMARAAMRVMFVFYGIVFAIASLMYIGGVEELPLFNAFSWRMFTETSGTLRFGILGVSGLALAILVVSQPGLVGSAKGRWILILALLGIVASGGRGTLMALFAILVLAYAIRRQRLGRTLLLGGMMLAALVVLSLSPVIGLLPLGIQRVFVILPVEAYGGLTGSMGDAAAAQSSSWRTLIWGVAFVEIVDHPIVGSGFGVPILQENDGEEGAQDLSAYNSLVTGNLHNAYLSIAYVMGLPALLAFIAWLAGLWRRLYTLYRNSPPEQRGWALWLLLALSSQLVQGLSGDIHTAMDFILTAAMGEATLIPNSVTTKGAPEP